MNRYSIQPNVFLQSQDVHLSRSQAIAQPTTSARLSDDVAALLAFLAHSAEQVAQAWTRAARRRATVQQMKRMDSRLLADVGIDYPNLRDVVDQIVAHRDDADTPPPLSAGYRPTVSAGA